MLNQVILVGRLNSIKKVKGTIESFKLDIKRQYPDEEGNDVYDNPIIKISNDFSDTLLEYMRDDMVVGVKARIETEVKGKYGTVMNIIADKMTFINMKED
jgi:hypothetical protein